MKQRSRLHGKPKRVVQGPCSSSATREAFVAVSPAVKDKECDNYHKHSKSAPGIRPPLFLCSESEQLAIYAISLTGRARKLLGVLQTTPPPRTLDFPIRFRAN
jgi:hypothetical protein